MYRITQILVVAGLGFLAAAEAGELPAVAGTTELIAVKPEISVDPAGGLGYGVSSSIATFKWDHLFLTPLECGHGSTGRGVYTYIGSRSGLPFYFGADDRHQVRLGIGVDFAFTFSNDMSGVGLFVSPSAQYVYQTSNGIFLGMGVSTFFFVGGEREGYPFFLLTSLVIGYSG